MELRGRPRWTAALGGAAALLLLHRGGASVAELQRWLRARRIRVVHSTVARWIDKNGAA